MVQTVLLCSHMPCVKPCDGERALRINNQLGPERKIRLNDAGSNVLGCAHVCIKQFCVDFLSSFKQKMLPCLLCVCVCVCYRKLDACMLLDVVVWAGSVFGSQSSVKFRLHLLFQA